MSLLWMEHEKKFQELVDCAFSCEKEDPNIFQSLARGYRRLFIEIQSITLIFCIQHLHLMMKRLWRIMRYGYSALWLRYLRERERFQKLQIM